MKSAVRPARLPPWLAAALGFALLNALLVMENRWPGLGVRWVPRLSFELALAVAALGLLASWRPSAALRLAHGLVPVLVLLVVVRYADVTVPAVLGRPVNVYWDGRHALELLRASGLTQHGAWLAAAGLAGLLGMGLVVGLVRWALLAMARGLALMPARPLRWVLAGGALVLVASFAAYVPGVRDTRWFFSLPVLPTVLHQALLVGRVLVPDAQAAVLGPGPAFDGDAGGLRTAQGAADVLLVFAESYGAVTLDHPELAAALAPSRQRLQQALQAGGRGAVSARVRSPTYGGASWLAHASLLSGLPITDPARHDLLLTGDRPTLVSFFAGQGYRTVGWMPGIKRAWPEGAFYGFDRVADDAGVGYQGPDFGYWRIPDQAALALLDRQELQRGGAQSPRSPRFAIFATTSTHAPFHPLAPLAADWTRLPGPQAYTAAQAIEAQAHPPSLQAPLPHYLAAMRYQFDWLSDYLASRAPRPLVMVVVGDHQPPALVTGLADNWDVPVHVISDDPALLDRLRAEGFAQGLAPPARTLGPLHALTPVLLRAFASPGAGPSLAGKARGVDSRPGS